MKSYEGNNNYVGKRANENPKSNSFTNDNKLQAIEMDGAN